MVVPGRAVADADVEQVELGVVGDGVPDGAAAAGLPPLAVDQVGVPFSAMTLSEAAPSGAPVGLGTV